MQPVVGGAFLSSNTNTVIEPNTTYRVTLIGTQLRYYKNGTQTQLITVTRGSFREPTATTKVGAWASGAGFGGFYRGHLYDIKIGGTLWTMADRNQTIQLPLPSGLGAELLNLNNIVWEASANRSAANDVISYTGVDSWGERAFRIPITVSPNVPYLVEFDVLEGYTEGQTIRFILNDKTGSGSPHVIPVTWPESLIFDTTSAYYGSFTNLQVRNGKVRGMFILPNATNLNWWISVRSQSSQQGRQIRLKGLSIKPLLEDDGVNLWAGRNLSPANAASVTTNTSGSSWTITRTGSAVPSDGGRSGDITTLEVGALYAFSVNASAPIHLANYDGGFVLKGQSQSNLLIFRAMSANKLYVSPVSLNTAVTITAPRLVKLSSLCNPLTLNNVVPEQWQEIPA
jgi:hypothetical protein